jgi:hypothetical protein
MILKPSEMAPISGMLFAEMIDETGFPKGVFNLINGDGVGVGSQISSHPDIDMVSFTGSTRAGRLISKNAAETIKRVCLELGGKGGNIVFADSYSDGAVIHPMDGGSNNVLGLISGGSVIIANTRPNGARGGQYGTDIKINAAILAMNGGFLSHYWQNSLTNYHNWNDGLTYGVIADGRGGHRNLYRSSEVDGIYTGDDDDRGTVHLWGSVVQFQRGYMKRNYPGPYNTSPGVGYDKDYHYDWNLQIKPPPYFPDLQNSNNTVILKMASYGEAKTQHQD